MPNRVTAGPQCPADEVRGAFDSASGSMAGSMAGRLAGALVVVIAFLSVVLVPAPAGSTGPLVGRESTDGGDPTDSGPGVAVEGAVALAPGPPAVVVGDPTPVDTHIPADPPVGSSPAGFGSQSETTATASFQISWVGSPPTAVRNAVSMAAQIWADHLIAPVPVVVQVTYTDLAGNTLGSAGPARLYRVGDDLVPEPLYNQLLGAQANADAEVLVEIDSSAPWYTGLDGNTPAFQYDLVTVMLHELGHALGFLGSARPVSSTTASIGYDLGGLVLPARFDRAVQSFGGTALWGGYPNPGSGLFNQITGGNLWFSTPRVLEANGGARMRLYAPNPWESGSSFSHFDEASYPPGDPRSLMTPSVSAGEAIHDPGDVTLAVLELIGWQTTLFLEAPGEPQSVTATAGNASATVGWAPPATGSQPIVSYQVTASPGGQSATVDGTADEATLTGLVNGTEYTFAVIATNAVGAGPPGLSNPVVPSDTVALPGYHPLSPTRILDTRSAIGAPLGRLGPGQTLVLDVTDTLGSGIPATGVDAVVLNVTATQPSAETFVTVWPSGASRPLASNLNVIAGQTAPNLVTVKVGPDGRIQLYNNSGFVHLVADVAGWYDDGSAPGARLTPLTPARILDTRKGLGSVDAPLGPGQTRTLDVTDTSGSGVPPAGVDAVVLNVTGTEATADTFLTVWPGGTVRPNASNLNVVAGDTVANLVIAKVGDDGAVQLYNSAGSVEVVADVVGYFADGGAVFHPLTPARILDTRKGLGSVDAPIGPGQTRNLDVTDTFGSGVPATGVQAVVVNLTAVTPTRSTHLTVWPTATTRPTASNLNLGAGQIRPNLVVAKVGGDGRVQVFNNSGSVEVVADIVGWYA